MVLDLLAHPERAELRRGGALLVDFGEPGDAKYTIGGFTTGFGRELLLQGATTRLLPAKVGRIALPAEGNGAAVLAFRARGFAPGPLSVHVNGEPLVDLALDGKDFQVFEAPIPAGLLVAGENRVQLRVTRSGNAAGHQDVGLALDWLELAPAGSPSKRDVPSLIVGGGRLPVPAGHSLGMTLELPARAALRALVHGKAKSRLRIVAVRDAAPPLVLQELDLQPGATPIDLDLGRLGGELVRLDLSAGASAIELEKARVVVPAESAALAKAPSAKNAIIVLIDTLRADKLSPYVPTTRVKTPGLSTFLQDAAVMLNARTQENWTKPSVATLLSSLLPWQHGAYTGDAKVPQSVELLPELLQKRGFFTGAFIANGYVSDKFGFKQGWNSYRNYIREGRRSTAQYVAADVLDWLDQRPKEKPFFLYVHTIDPHVPYKPPEHFLAMYDALPYSGPVDFKRTNELLEKIKIGSIKLAARDKERLAALYDGEISYHDVHFAAVMKGLEERGLADDTVVVITADHGEEFWDHGSVGHGHSVYDELLHVPLIVRVPGLTQHKQRVTDSVGLLDVMPTILDALGQEIPETLPGRSFLPELRGEASPAPRAVPSGFMTGWRTLAVGRYKLIQRTLDKSTLYDTQADPHETRDLSKERPLAHRYTRALLGLTLAEQTGQSEQVRRARSHTSEKTEIDPATEAQLRALGYVGSSAK
jgi:arylsulfatase A-like enzyme